MKTLYIALGAVALTASPGFAQTTRTVTIDTPRVEGERTITRDPATGTVARDAELTRKSDGATATRSYDRQRTETGVTASGSSTGFGGRTRSFDYERVRDGNGGFTSNGTVTRRDGETFTGTGSRTRTDDGFTSNRNVLNGAGETVYNRDASVSRSNGQVRRSVDVTRAEGFRRPRANGPRGLRGPRGRRR